MFCSAPLSVIVSSSSAQVEVPLRCQLLLQAHIVFPRDHRRNSSKSVRCDVLTFPHGLRVSVRYSDQPAG